MIKDVSDSGRWERGMFYEPVDGHCKGHLVEVLNPEVELVKDGRIAKIVEGQRVLVEIQAIVPCVLVRCMDCKASWSFSEQAEMPEGVVVYRVGEE